MSPEQAAGRWDVINTASDVYGLGAVLYAILTNKPPVEGNNWPEMQQKIQRGDFPKPRTVQPKVPRALEAVCLRAMAMKPEERYPSARELAAEVELWLADEPVKAYREPVTTRVWRWTRRHKGWVVSGSSVCVALITIGVGTTLVMLARQAAEIERASAVNTQRNIRDNNLLRIAPRFENLDKSVRTTLDQVAETIGQDPRLAAADCQPVRREVLEQLIVMWDQVIRGDVDQLGNPGFNTAYYRLQKALCLARLDQHQQALDEVRIVQSAAIWKLATGEEKLVQQKEYDLARIYALCAGERTKTESQAKEFADSAMTHLRAAAQGGYFKDAAAAQSFSMSRDFDHMRGRPDFQTLLEQLKASEN
jgi:hypothetical protein